MHILHVIESVEPEAGSVAVSLRGLVQALAERGIESESVTRVEAAAADPLVHQASVVHLHGWGTGLARRMARVARQTGKPYVVSPLGSLTAEPYHKRGWRDKLRGLLGSNSLIRGAAAVTALNAAEQQALRANRLNVNARVLPYGLDTSAFEATDRTNDALPEVPAGRCLLILGPIHPAEGLVPLMTAFAEIGPAADGWNIVLAGPEVGDWRRQLEAAVRRKGAAERVLFAPAPDVATQRAWLARASVLAAPSLHYRCPVSIMQALAAGVPVVASGAIVPDGLNDVLQACAPTREALREALRFVFGLSDEERSSAAQRARAAVRARLDWSVLVDRYVQLYQELTNSD